MNNGNLVDPIGLTYNIIDVSNSLRQYALVKLTDEYRALYKKYHIDNDFLKERCFIFLGEIPNMPEHCVVIGNVTKKIYSGYHITNFVELNEYEV